MGITPEGPPLHRRSFALSTIAKNRLRRLVGLRNKCDQSNTRTQSQVPESTFLESQENDRDEVSDCPVCKRTADYFEQSESYSSESMLFCNLTLGKVTEFQSQASCATCQNILHLLKDQVCHGNKQGSEHATLCESCTVLLSYSKGVPQGYGYYISLMCGFSFSQLLTKVRPHVSLILQNQLRFRSQLPGWSRSWNKDIVDNIYPTWFPKPTERRSDEEEFPREFGIDVPNGPIDISRITRWIQYCDESHNLCQERFSRELSLNIPPAFLIDVVRLCLVPCPIQSPKYVTLSYVWGQGTPTLEARKSNIHKLCQQGSLDSKYQQHIPKTIDDAMKLCQMINVKYLWVDRLCIIQDDQSALQSQLAIMHQIYKQSYFTIIAADGDSANYGLPGIGTSERNYKPALNLRFSSSVQFSVIKYRESMSSPWHQRGWTFQERSLSPRALVFHDQTVYWQCSSRSFQEVCSADDDGDYMELEYKLGAYIRNHAGSDENFPAFTFPHSASPKENPVPDLTAFWRLAGAYSKRKLSYQADAEKAFSAILGELSRSFYGGFFYGLPILNFNYCLLWSFSPGTIARRRVDFPSWSWLGWDGEVSTEPFGVEPTNVWQPLKHGSFGKSVTEFQGKWEPLTKCWRLKINGSRAPISNLYPRNGTQRDGSDAQKDGWDIQKDEWDIEKDGWNIHVTNYFTHPELRGQYKYPFRVDRTDFGLDDINERGYIPFRPEWEPIKRQDRDEWGESPAVYFTHNQWPKERFLHPFPIPKTPESNGESSESWLPFLEFHAQSYIATIMPSDDSPQTVLLEHEALPGELFAKLYPDLKEYSDLLPGTRCQLVVIARWCDRRLFRVSDDTLAALWIEWKGNEAYRKGYASISGAHLISKDQAEMVDVRLG